MRLENPTLSAQTADRLELQGDPLSFVGACADGLPGTLKNLEINEGQTDRHWIWYVLPYGLKKISA